MTCNAPEREALTFLAAGTLDPAESDAAIAHLGGCVSCQAEWPQLRSWIEGLRSLHLASDEVVAAAWGRANPPHLEECARCRAEVEALRAVNRSLAKARPFGAPAWRPWALAAGAAFVAFAAVVLLRETPLGRPPAGVEEAGRTTRGVPSAAPAPSSRPVTPDRRVASLDRLAMVEPPHYLSGSLRSGPGAAEPAGFAEAVGFYERGDYAAAAAALDTLARAHPDSAAVGFFLGVSELLSGRSELAARQLGRIAQLKDGTYSEAARFFLAKALLRQGDVSGARAELRTIVGLDGDYRVPARELLEALGRLDAKP